MIKLVKHYLKDYIGDILVNLLVTIVQIVFQSVFIINEMKYIIDNGVMQNNMPYIIQSGIKMLIFTVAAGLCTVVTSYLSAKIVAGVVCAIRKDCFSKVIAFSAQDYNKFGVSTLMTRTSADCVQIQILLINFMRSCLMLPIMIGCIMIMIFRMNMVLFWVLTVAFALTIAMLVYFGAKSKASFEILQNKIDRISLLVKEKLVGVRAVRAFRNQNLEEEKLSVANEDAYEAAIMANGKINFLAPISLVIMNWTVVVIYFIGSKQLQAGMASISDLLVIFQYLVYFISSLTAVPILINMLPKAAVSSKRINELLDYEQNVKIAKNTRTEGITEGEIEFKHVIFGYSGATDVIADVSFTAKPGQTTAFIGTTGSGKTTIMNLILRLYEMNFGEIKIDGTSIRDYDSDYLRSRISYATQKPMVFQDTVKNNIMAYDENCSQERMMAACDASEFAEVLEKLPNGLETEMAQGGMNISGGQRQRLSLARTLAKDADIYIFDDTFSALDAKTEASARRKIKEMLKGKTVLMVAQKISTIVDADQIVVLDRGRIAGKGTHEELLKNCKEYQEIYQTQCYVGKEEM